MSSKWENHYKREKSILSYPDENLVRMLQRFLKKIDDLSSITAIDLGCGSGRHLKLLSESGISFTTGIDNSFNALRICRDTYDSFLIQSDNRSMPIKNNIYNIAIAWGSLHYNHKNQLPGMVDEILRILKPGGALLATLRTDNDTLLKRGRHIENNVWQTDLDDLEGSIVSFFSENELQDYFRRFSSFEYGIMERSLVGNTGKIVSHWVISAVK